MTQNNRNQPPRKESQGHENTKQDERDKLPPPDIDFPETSSGTGGGEK